MTPIPVETIVRLKIRRVNQQEIQYTMVRIIEHIKIAKATDTVMYVGLPISIIPTKQEEINFFKNHVIREFGDISEKELIENYPEYMI